MWRAEIGNCRSRLLRAFPKPRSGFASEVQWTLAALPTLAGKFLVGAKHSPISAGFSRSREANASPLPRQNRESHFGEALAGCRRTPPTLMALIMRMNAEGSCSWAVAGRVAVGDVALAVFRVLACGGTGPQEVAHRRSRAHRAVSGAPVADDALGGVAQPALVASHDEPHAVGGVGAALPREFTARGQRQGQARGEHDDEPEQGEEGVADSAGDGHRVVVAVGAGDVGAARQGIRCPRVRWGHPAATMELFGRAGGSGLGGGAGVYGGMAWLFPIHNAQFTMHNSQCTMVANNGNCALCILF